MNTTALTLRDTDNGDIRHITDWVAFDTETHLIGPGQVAPIMVCGTFCDAAGNATLMLREEALDLIESLLVEGTVLVGQNMVFDMAVCIRNRPRLRVPIFRAFERGLILSIDVIEKLRKIARGWNKFDHRFKSKPRYSLEEMVFQYLDEKMTGKKEADAWRYRYKELDNVPLEDWPAAAAQYAQDDAIYTARVFRKQQEALSGDVQFKTTLVDLRRQQMAAWGLYLMGLHGFRTDSLAVDMLDAELHEHVDREIPLIIDSGLMRYEGPKKDPKRKTVRNMSIIEERVRKAFEARDEAVPMTEGGKGEVKNPKPKTGVETLLLTRDPDLVRLADIMGDKKLMDTYIPVLKDGIRWPINPRYNVLVDSGRTSCSSPNVQNQPRKGGVRESFVPRPGHVYVGCDYHTAELRSLAQYCLEVLGVSEMAEALRHTEKYPHGKDLHLVMACQLLHITYDEAEKRAGAGDRAVKDARQLAKCFHPETEVLTKTGWRKIADLLGTEEIATPTLLPDGDVSLSWEVPLRLTYREHSGVLVHLRSEGIDLKVTPDHRMVGYTTGKGENRLGKIKEYTPYDLGNARWWVNAGHAPDGPGLAVSDAVLRLLVAVQADGSYVKDSAAIRLGFTKGRKIERLKEILAEAKWPHHWQKISSQGASSCYIGTDDALPLRLLLDAKQFPVSWIARLTAHQRDVVLDEAAFWDSCKMSNWTAYDYVSTSKQSAEVLQALATLSGRKTRMTRHVHGGPRKDSYKLVVKDHHHSRGGNLETKEIDYTGEVYCLTTSTDCVLVRAGDSNIPVITKQCLNFGYPGGLGAQKFLDFAWTTYRMRLADTEWESLREAKQLKAQWMEAFPEMKLFFNHVNGLIAGADAATVHLIKSGRVRGDVKYTELCNTIFQSLTADGAKMAVWAVVKESWTGYVWDQPIPDDATTTVQDSPLFGFRPSAFIHDEIMGESPLALYKQHAARLAEVMKQAMRWFVDLVPVEADAHCMRRWWKDAEPTFDENGELIPWSPKNPHKVLKKLKEDHPLVGVPWGDTELAQLAEEFPHPKKVLGTLSPKHPLLEKDLLTIDAGALAEIFPDVPWKKLQKEYVDWKSLHRAWMLDELAKERTGEVEVLHA